ncbi:MAG: hypothetical protein JRH20_20865 [Deltaproteobacteria bacterium]|nr:hypothetical protein [Deltaproteobacteria bacterium]
MTDSFDRRRFLGGLGASGLLSACGFASKPSAPEGVQLPPRSTPLIDLKVPEHLETASFALG